MWSNLSRLRSFRALEQVATAVPEAQVHSAAEVGWTASMRTGGLVHASVLEDERTNGDEPQHTWRSKPPLVSL